ncbi:MAG: YncE family protein, partial [Gemmatimonadaceae bacterium]
LLAAPAAAPLAAQTPSSGYHVIRHIPITGDGGWDYITIDTASNRLFIARGTRVQVVDLKTSALVGEVKGTSGVHGVAIDPATQRAYTSNGRDTTAAIFDVRTLTPQKTVRVTGANPDAILFEPVTRRIFTFNGRGQNATAIDASADTVVGSVALGGKPETAVADRAGHVFVNIEDKSQLVEFDAATLAVMHTYPLAPCESPSGLAMDKAHSLLFVGCDNKMMGIVNAATGRVIATPPSGSGTDANAFDAERGLAFSSNGGDGTLTVVRQTGPSTFTSENIPTARGARTMALDPRTHLIYMVTAKFNPAAPPTAEQPRPRPTMIPGTFEILVVGK